ncbi:MAG: hypothetical protein ABSA26_11725 [Thermoguttaceae bacterium]
MTSVEKTLHDPLIEEVRATRQRLVEEHGGLNGWIDHLQEEQNKQKEKPVDLRTDKTAPLG